MRIFAGVYTTFNGPEERSQRLKVGAVNQQLIWSHYCSHPLQGMVSILFLLDPYL